MNLLIVRLITFLNGQTTETTNYHIAVTMLNHYDNICSMSIGEIAKLCDVSKSTVSKFARTLGFDDYIDLKDNAVFIENRFNNPLNYVSNIITSIENEGYNEYFDAIIKDIDFFKSHFDLSIFDRVAKEIYTHDKVMAFGLIFSESAAIDLQYKLAYNGKFIHTFQDDLVQENFLRTAKEDTLILIFTNSGNYLTKQQIRAGTPKKSFFSQTKAKIIVISSNPKVLDFPFVEDAIIFPHQTNYQTHTFMYHLITDLIVARYRKIKNNEVPYDR
ncbi:MurR/RpiR family transcriptional regulator [Candidatus Enterococcus murrayae]|uniref:MurR/RpiR family transcriptional regulator n=1 Tax=Candidatus Enterococcus murrayae TaxID=2815321 RepID=A0ABS3HJY1_9ENTE|nr:MurR/RpiR family transcriptional regulator [Enterococcus sp. MJM16]MBO0453761.1 MurR/RpiR family transcriptional regulator [Enterococcus sp. MJM16]